MKRAVLSALAVLGVWTWVYGEDFNQWRGPQRNGLTSGGPALDIRWGKTGPARLWESEEIPGMLEEGSGCVSVAEGRAYVYVHWKYNSPIATRTLSESALRRLGWTDRKMPEDILKAVEEARIAPELEKLTGRPRAEWIKKWADAHVSTATDTRPVVSYVVDRVNRGKKALPLDLLAKLGTIKNKQFPDQASLDAWFTDNGVSAEHKAEAMKVIPTYVRKSWDALVCLNAANGKTLWKKQFEGSGPLGYPYGASSTPTVVDGRCYFLGSKNDIYCVDAVTGEEAWQIKVNPPPSGWILNHSSPLLMNDMAVVTAGPLCALVPSTGTEIWQQPKVSIRESSPVAWRSGDRTFLLCNTGGAKATIHCVDLRDGAIVWSVPGGGRNTPTVVGDFMITSVVIGKFIGDPTKYGLVAYKLSAEKAEKLWSTEEYSAGDESALIHDGYVYNFGSGVAVCIELATGKVAWEQKTTHRGVRSPVLADGKIITTDGSSILVIRATPEKYELLGKAKVPIGKYTSPAVADGRLYLRQQENVACYDLTRPTATTAPATLPASR
jgi:outer membrane protein assembly factor BamB